MSKKAEKKTVHSKEELREYSSAVLAQFREECRIFVNQQINREIAHQEAAREYGDAGKFDLRERMIEEVLDARWNIDCYKQEMIYCDEILTERICKTQLTLWNSDHDDIPF